jgi:hypothetical protein
MSASPAPDPMERLFTLSPDEQRVFTPDAPPRSSGTIEASTPGDVTLDAAPDEATAIDSEDSAAGDKKTGGEGILEVVAEGTPDILEFVFSDVFGSLLEWLE